MSAGDFAEAIGAGTAAAAKEIFVIAGGSLAGAVEAKLASRHEVQRLKVVLNKAECEIRHEDCSAAMDRLLAEFKSWNDDWDEDDNVLEQQSLVYDLIETLAAGGTAEED